MRHETALTDSNLASIDIMPHVAQSKPSFALAHFGIMVMMVVVLEKGADDGVAGSMDANGACILRIYIQVGHWNTCRVAINERMTH